MKSKIGIISIAAVVAVLAIMSLATKSRVSSSAQETANPAEPTTLAQASGASDSGQELSAEEAYLKLRADLKELEGKAQTERSAERRMDILKEMDVLLSEFIDSYHGTPEAHEASFELGMVSFVLQKPEKTIRYMEGFLHNSQDAPRDKQAYAHFYLAEAFRLLGKYDETEAEYKIILGQFKDVNPQLSKTVETNMAMLGSERKLKVGGEPIPFEVSDVNGKKLSPEMYKGKVLLLDFWATWCGPCRQEMPNVIKVYDRYKDKGFEIVGISLDRSRSDFDRYVAQYKMTWPQYYDGKFWQNEVATLYGVKSIPATFLIDKKGKIRYKSLRGNQLESAVKKLLDE
jgi:thiol-disulfide isomerase/thioredoxin